MTYTIGYASGVFDLFHVGHLALLERASRQCAQLVVGVASDEYVLAAKGRPPAVPYEERRAIVSAIRCTDAVVRDDSEDKREVWARRPFDVIFKGDDWKGRPKGDRLERHMASVGAKVHYFPYTTETSSSALRSYLHAVEAAQRISAHA
jgi:glycerol-3-phosphate cytidylyltransferase